MPDIRRRKEKILILILAYQKLEELMINKEVLNAHKTDKFTKSSLFKP